MEPFQHEGVWWDPQAPSARWVGTFRFDTREGLALKLVVPLDKPTFFGGSAEYARLLGLTPDGKEITLLRCHEVHSSGGVLAGSVRAREIHANAAIVGFHADDADPVLASVTAKFLHLNEWLGHHGLEWDRTVELPDAVVRYSGTAPLLLHDDGIFRVSIRSGLSGSVGNRRAALEEEAQLDFHAATPKPYSEFQPYFRACGDLLSVGWLTLCETAELELLLPAVDGMPTERGTYHAVPVHRSRDHRSIGPDMLFRFRDIESRAPALFSSWLSEREALSDARALYGAGAYGRGFIEGKLLSLTQAVEAFHRQFRPGEYIDDKVFRATVLKPLLAAVPAQADKRLRKSIGDRLNFANEFSQRERIESLVREYAAALQVLVEDPLAYVAAIVKHRNAFTHFSPKARKANRTKPVAPERVLLYNFFLRMLLEACFLERMGFTNSEITAIFQRSDTYRQISERFRAWKVVPEATRVSEQSAPAESREQSE